MPLPDELSREYELRFREHAAYRDRVWRLLCGEYFQRLVPPDARALDLGSGWGEFIRHIRAGEKFAMDLNPDGRERVGPGVTFLEQDCSLPWPLADGALDVVFSSNFLEHLPDKAAVSRTLAEARRCLSPGGRLICMGPNIRYVPGAYWDFFDHFVPLTERSLGEAMRLSGLEIEREIPRFLPYSMSQGRRPPVELVRWYLKLPWAWRWFGKQFLVIGRRAV